MTTDEINEQPDATPDNFAKIYGTILDSSIWEEPHHTVRVWITMLVMADPQGVVRASYSGLRRRSGVTMEELAEALEVLEKPDSDSRNPDHNGCRIVKIKGGWFIYNAKEYRDLRTKDQIAAAERAKRFREKRKGHVTNVTDNVTDHGSNTNERTEREGEVEVDALSHPRIEARPWDDDGIITRFCRQQEYPESWRSLLAGFQAGLGLATGKATEAQVAQACLEAETLTGDMSARRFRRVLQQVMEKPEAAEDRRKGPRSRGQTRHATTLIMNLRQKRLAQFPASIPGNWKENLTEIEVIVVQPFLVRIFADNPNGEGTLVAQLARAFEEAE